MKCRMGLPGLQKYPFYGFLSTKGKNQTFHNFSLNHIRLKLKRMGFLLIRPIYMNGIASSKGVT